MSIDYTSHAKEEMSKGDPGYYRALLEVWQAMFGLQQ
jgi:hypothetical protein